MGRERDGKERERGEEREKGTGWLGGRKVGELADLAEHTNTHTNTATKHGHHTQTHTHTQFDRSDLELQTDTHTRAPFDRSCMEHPQYTNTTHTGLREQTLDLDNDAYTHYRTDSRMDVGRIGPATNTHTGQPSGFSQDFLNFLAGAPLSRQEHTANQVANEQLDFANEQLNWSNESCVSESVIHRSELSSRSSISSNDSQFEQLISNPEHPLVRPVSHVELPNALNNQNDDVVLTRQSRKNNVECPNELRREERVSALKDTSRYIDEAEWPLLDPPATVRRSGPTGGGLNPSNGAGETSNDQ